MKIIIFDTETSGTNPRWNQILQLSYQVVDSIGWKLLKERDMFFPFPEDPERVSQGALDTNGLSKEILETKETISRKLGLLEFRKDLEGCFLVIGHNVDFDIRFFLNEALREGLDFSDLKWPRIYDTMKRTVDYCALPSGNTFRKYKSPKLSELGEKLECDLSDIKLHDSSADVELTKRCFIKLVEKNLYKDEEARTFCCISEPTASEPPREIHIGSGWDFRDILLMYYEDYYGKANSEMKDFFKTAIDPYDWSRATSIGKLFPTDQEKMNMYSLEEKYKTELGPFLIFSTIMHNTYQSVSSPEFRETLKDCILGKIIVEDQEFKNFLIEESKIPWSELLKAALRKLKESFTVINPIDIILLVTCPTVHHFEDLYKKWSGKDVQSLKFSEEFKALFKRNREYELNYKLQLKKLLGGQLC